ncbi:MAG: hypothetical protein A2086_16425 [Spirochaetes bacterium GWD1_27_9]|nr:MAG: hypothetical protein A2Z98_03105 [Spirochaetes bacterium GWB1_27_13]OHD27806.1 MAG: hypothetical protein A2Y34_16590 [Spirochaetes bacterium GWC1_27_15]OHD33018.1 MAG: hypothetical protein A2086_16425 [Spirochaetes bacterium GWD1_27_9]
MDKIYNILLEFNTNPYNTSIRLNEILKTTKDWDYPYILLGNLYEKNNLMHKSIEFYEKAISIGISQKSLSFEVYYSLATQYIKIGNITKGEYYLSKSRNLKPKTKSRLESLKQSTRLLTNLKNAISNIDTNPETSINILNNILLEKDDWFYAQKLLGLAYEKNGEPDKALETYKNLLLYLNIKNIVLAGEKTTPSDGIYTFIRNKNDTGLWELKLYLPKGKYKYRFIKNFGYPDEGNLIDKNNPISVRTEKGGILNIVEVKKDYEELNFSYKTLPEDSFITNIMQNIAELRKSELLQQYSTVLYGQNVKVKKMPITFRYYNPNAYAVWVVGSFNRFGKNGSETTILDPNFYWNMEGPDENGFWELEVYIYPGEYFYNFVVNEELYVKDSELMGDFDYIGKDKSEEEQDNDTLKGFYDNGNYVVFIFNKNDYKYIKPISKVMPSGDFNNWITFSAGTAKFTQWLMNDEGDGIWTYEIPKSLIDSNIEFKFIVNANEWQEATRNYIVKYGVKSSKYKNLLLHYDTDAPKEFNMWSRYSRFRVGKLIDTYFSYKNRKAKNVRIVGTFNDWGKYNNILIPDYNMKGPDQNDRWHLKLKLPAGRYEYKYIVDGYNWVKDTESKTFSGDNSEIKVIDK